MDDASSVSLNEVAGLTATPYRAPSLELGDSQTALGAVSTLEAPAADLGLGLRTPLTGRAISLPAPPQSAATRVRSGNSGTAKLPSLAAPRTNRLIAPRTDLSRIGLSQLGLASAPTPTPRLAPTRKSKTTKPPIRWDRNAGGGAIGAVTQSGASGLGVGYLGGSSLFEELGVAGASRP